MMHGQVITYNDIKQRFPKRRDYLNPSSVSIDVNRFNEKQPIYFHPNDVEEFTIQYPKGSYKYNTYVVCSGITPSGLKVVVAIKTEPMFYLRIPDEYLGIDILGPDEVDSSVWVKAEQFKSAVKALFISEGVITERNSLSDKWEIARFHQAREFQTCRGFYIKLVFNTVNYRKKAINLISYEASGYKAKRVMGHICHTAIDDLSCYYRLLSRHRQINLCSWNTITNYTIEAASPKKIDWLGDFRGDYLIMTNETDICETPQEEITPQMRNDRSIEVAWDIECYRAADDGELPDPRNPDDSMFMIGLTISFHGDQTPLMRVCICDSRCEARDDDLTIYCPQYITPNNKTITGEVFVIRAFAEVLGAIQPEFIVGFNDGDFDYKYLAERAYMFDMLEYYKMQVSILYVETELRESDKKLVNQIAASQNIPEGLARIKVMNRLILGSAHYDNQKAAGRGFNRVEVKIDAETRWTIWQLKFFGTIPIDVRCIFMSLYKNPEKTSLNYFLEINQLQQKEDMSIRRLFDIYRHASSGLDAEIEEAPNMAEIKKYCVTDAESCHRLMLKKNVIMDRRSVSSIAYTSMWDAIVRADGLKVRNLTIKEAFNRGILFSNIANNIRLLDGKYPGAYVVPPHKGMQVSRLSLRELRESSRAGHGFLYEYPHTYYIHATPSIVYPPNIDYTEYRYDDLSDDVIERVESWIAQNYVKLKTAQLNDDAVVFNELLASLNAITNNSAAIQAWMLSSTGNPVSGIDFSSLYPSLMMAYNLSIEKIICKDYNDINGHAKLESKAQQLRDRGYDLHKIKFEFGPRNIEGYSVRHKYDPQNPDSDPVKDGFGIFPTILLNLFNRRTLIKKELEGVAKYIEECDAGLVERDDAKYSDAVFKSNYLDAIQKAVKIFMNTFYGESGNQISPMFMLELSGGITSAGQFNLRFIIDRILETGAKVIYGDTDSAYVQCNESLYLDIAAQYYSGQITKQVFWTRTVDLTFAEINRINKFVNESLFINNGTRFLRTAYEEVLFPVAFLAKKKYYGIAHEHHVNFKPKKLFIRGIDIKKRGIPSILKEVVSSIMWKSVAMDEIRTLRQITYDDIDGIYSREWQVSDFHKAISYKPHKNNVPVQTFVKRMKEERGIIIKPVERVNVVFIKKAPFYFDIRGHKIWLKSGDFMELAEVAAEHNMPINLDHYVISHLVGPIARLIIYDREFQVSDDEMGCHESAKKWIQSLTAKYATIYEDNGRKYKRIYSHIAKSINEKINNHHESLGAALDIIGKSTNDIIAVYTDELQADAALWALRHFEIMKSKDTVRSIYREYVVNNKLREVNNGLHCSIEKQVRELGELIRKYSNIANLRDTLITEIATSCRNENDIEIPIDDILKNINIDVGDIQRICATISNLKLQIKSKIKNEKMIDLIVKENNECLPVVAQINEETLNGFLKDEDFITDLY